MNAMIILISIAFLATIFSFIAGNISMAVGGNYDDAHSEDLMDANLVLYGLTILLIVLAVVVW